MANRPTVYDVAKRASVSQTTVSYVLTNRPDAVISKETRQAVLDAAKELGYRPNLAARLLASTETKTMSLWINLLSSALYLNWIQHMEEEVSSKGYNLVFTKKHYNGLGSGLQNASEWPVDGIFAYGLLWLPEFLKTSPLHVPLVVIGQTPVHGFDYVGMDMKSPSEECIMHLISTGRKRIAYFHTRYSPGVRIARQDAYEETMAQAGLQVENIISSDATRATAYATASIYVQQNGVPDAIVCTNDDLAIATLRAMKDLGIQVPGDVAIAGCDGLEDTAYHDPRLTTIALPYQEVCEHAWRFMEERLNSPVAPPKEVMLKPRLILRESTA